MFDDAEITRANIVATIAAALALPGAAVDAQIDYAILGPKPAGRDYIMANSAEWEPEVD
jgi:hypothetical protein